MKKNNQRIAFRLPLKQRQQIDELVNSSKFKNLSEVVREALEQFFQKRGEDHES